MLPAQLTNRLPPALQSQLTPRRQRTGLALLVLALLYSLLGFLMLPGVVISQAKKFVQDELKLELAIERLQVNPWRLAVRIDGLGIKEPGGETLIAARSVFINAQLWHSLWMRGASLDELDLLEPYVNARMRKDGSLNLLQLLPPEDPASTGDTAWRIGKLGIHAARIDVHDDSRPTPFSTVFSPLNLALTEIGSRPDANGNYNLRAETGEQEVLEWEGSLALQPMRSTGTLAISGLRATTPWRYLQDDLPVVVKDGRISIKARYDLVAAEEVKLSLTDGRLSVDDLKLHQKSANPLHVALQHVELAGLTLAWPASTAGFDSVVVQDFQLLDKPLAPPLATFGKLSFVGGRYEPQPENVSLKSLVLNDLLLADTPGNTALMALPGLELHTLSADMATQVAHVSRIVLNAGNVAVLREKDGGLNWERQLAALEKRVADGMPASAGQVTATTSNTATVATDTATGTAAATAPAKPWVATLGELDLENFRVAIEDRVPVPTVKTSLESIRMRIFPRQSEAERHALEGNMTVGTGGTLGFKGKFAEQPLALEADIDLQNMALPPFASYASEHARLALESGFLETKGRLRFDDGKTTQASFDGRVAIRQFAANDLDEDQRFLAWNNLVVDGLHWQMAPGRVTVRDILADRLFAKIEVGTDESINVVRVLDTGSAEVAIDAPQVAAATSEPPYPLRIDRVRLVNGALLFADLTLKPQFATGIESLNGDIRGLSTTAGSRAVVKLDGRVDEYGQANIQGQLNPLAGDLFTDIAVKFTNLELTTLTPYSSKFAGYRIDKGKLSMDLNYHIENRQLKADNKIVFNQLTLGEKVDSPDAMSLPLKLAVAILKDRHGVIDVNLPVTGSLDDPKFRIGPLVWKAMLNLLTKAATAPFSMLAGLVGGGDDLDTVVFAPGTTALSAEGGEKLAKIADALGARPALGLEIRGAFDPKADTSALQRLHFDTAYRKQFPDGERTVRRLETLFRDKLGSEALARQRSLSQRPTEGGNLEVAEGLYMKVLEDELSARETIVETDLRQLALDRARAIRGRIMETGKVEEARVFVLEPVTMPADATGIPMKVAVTAS